MDEQTRKRLDSVLEDELHRGYRIKELPETLRMQLEAESGVAITRVRFTRLNPAKRRKIAQVVQRQYHKDLQNQDILSHEQILKLVQERGEWSPELDKEMERLQKSTAKEMGELFSAGATQDSWTEELFEAAAAFRALVGKHITDPIRAKQVLDQFDRWMEFTEDKRELYNRVYASEQKRETYSVDVDMQQLLNSVPDLTAVDYLHQVDELRDRLHRYVALQRDRVRLAELQLKHVKIFSDSVEQRRDNTEEMARLYFITELVDDLDKPTGPMVDEFEKLWDFPEAVVQWFLVEAYFFLNGIPDEAREYLQTFGFLAADAGETTSESGASEPSDESAAPQNFRLESNPAVETASDSSVSAVATT